MAKDLKEVVKQLKGAVIAHGKQAKTIQSHIDSMEKMNGSPGKMNGSPMLLKLSASCKAAAKKKFKVYPSAYANIWASKKQKAGGC